MFHLTPSSLYGLCILWMFILPTQENSIAEQSEVKVYTVEISTTDAFRLPEARSNVAFRLTLFGTKGELGHFVPGGTDHQALQKIFLPFKDLGRIYEVAIYTVKMGDPWHVRTVSVREGESGRTFCFLFDKWIGWGNTIIWSSCIEDNCGCHWPDKENYMVLVHGPMPVETEIRLYGTMGDVSELMEPSTLGDAWEGWHLSNVGDIQKIGVNCTSKADKGPYKLKRVYVSRANEYIWRCFKFNRAICNPTDRSSFYVEEKCANVDCSCT
jgi:hypothetical protein